MMVGRLTTFSDGIFSGVMLNLRGVKHQRKKWKHFSILIPGNSSLIFLVFVSYKNKKRAFPTVGSDFKSGFLPQILTFLVASIYICIYISIFHTHTHIYIYIYIQYIDGLICFSTELRVWIIEKN